VWEAGRSETYNAIKDFGWHDEQKAAEAEAAAAAATEAPADEAAVQLDKWYTLFEDSNPDVGDHGYQRATTPRFSADSDDIFMRSMIQQYAVEAGDCDEDADGNEVNCKPSGKFWMSKSGAMAAAQEILATHKGLSGADLQTYIDNYFEKAWGHFDVNQTGHIEVIKMPQFARFICSDQRMQLGESGQK